MDKEKGGGKGNHKEWDPEDVTLADAAKQIPPLNPVIFNLGLAINLFIWHHKPIYRGTKGAEKLLNYIMW